MGGGGHPIRVKASCGAGVLISYLKIEAAPDPSLPDRYHQARASDADHVVAAIAAAGGQALTLEWRFQSRRVGDY